MGPWGRLLVSDIPKTIIWEPTQKVDQKPARMLRCMKMRGGMVAVPGQVDLHQDEPISRTAASTSRAMMRPSFH